MIPIVLSLQSQLDQANNKVLQEFSKLNDIFSKSKFELSVTKQVNSLLSSRLVNMERHCWARAQYSRRECLDIINIPSEVKADVLEEKVINTFEKLGCNISSNRAEACHRVSKRSATVVVKSIRRKGCQQVLAVKQHLQKIKMEDVDLHLCPYYKVLWFKSKNRHSLGRLLVTQSSIKSVKIVYVCP